LERKSDGNPKQMCEEGMNEVIEEKLGHKCDIDEEKKKGLAVRR